MIYSLYIRYKEYKLGCLSTFISKFLSSIFDAAFKI